MSQRRRSTPPDRVMVAFSGVDYWMDLTVCRMARVRRQVERELESIEDLATLAGVSRHRLAVLQGAPDESHDGPSNPRQAEVELR